MMVPSISGMTMKGAPSQPASVSTSGSATGTPTAAAAVWACHCETRS